jgi:predicted RNA-binding protein with TRAM domain
MKTSLRVGEVYDVVIDKIGAKGDPIAHIDSLVVIVFSGNVNVGDRCKVEIASVRDRFAFARVKG